MIVLGAFDGNVFADDIEIIFGPGQESVDLGDITSTGENGRQLFVEPTDPTNPFRQYRFFPPHDVFPEQYPPAPPSPRQDSIRLIEGTPLTVVIPHLAHFPFGAEVQVSHLIHDGEILVNASMHHYASATATIYGPHEYLLPIGELKAGEYRLTLDLTRTAELWQEYPSHMTGYIRFTVSPVPEPSSVALLLITVSCFILRRTSWRR